MWVMYVFSFGFMSNLPGSWSGIRIFFRQDPAERPCKCEVCVQAFESNPWILRFCSWKSQDLNLTRPIFPKWWWKVREIPSFQGNLGWWNIMIWPDFWCSCPFRSPFYCTMDLALQSYEERSCHCGGMCSGKLGRRLDLVEAKVLSLASL